MGQTKALAVSSAIFVSALALLFIETSRRTETVLASTGELDAGRYAVLGTFALALVATCVLLYSIASGRRIRLWIFAALAVVPWLVGVAATRIAFGSMERIVYDYTPPGMESSIVLPQLAYALRTWTLGSTLSGVLLASSSVGLATAAYSMDAPARRRLFALPQLFVGFVSVALLWILDDGDLHRNSFAVVAVVSCALALAIATASVGRDEDGRSGATALGAASLGLFSVVVFGVASHAIGLYTVLHALCESGSFLMYSNIGVVEERCAAELWLPVEAAIPLACGLVLLAVLVLGRSPPSSRVRRGAVVFVLIAIGSVAIDRMLPHWTSNEIEWLKNADRTGLGSPE